MPRVISEDIITYLETGGSFTVEFLVRIEFPDPYKLTFTTGLDNYTYDGDTFLAVGAIGSVSMPQGDGEISPKTYTVTLNGISNEVLEAATQINYINNLATCWAIFKDADLNQLGDPVVMWRGLTDQISIAYGKTSTVTCAIRDRLVDWERPRIDRYTHADQIARYPNDKFFEFIPEIARKDEAWPEANWFKNNS